MPKIHPDATPYYAASRRTALRRAEQGGPQRCRHHYYLDMDCPSCRRKGITITSNGYPVPPDEDLLLEEVVGERDGRDVPPTPDERDTVYPADPPNHQEKAASEAEPEPSPPPGSGDASLHSEAADLQPAALTVAAEPAALRALRAIDRHLWFTLEELRVLIRALERAGGTPPSPAMPPARATA